MTENRQPYRIALVVSAIIEDDQNRLLMVKEAHPDYFGRWNQPAGHVDANESIAEALLREVREETGYLHVRIDGLSKVYYFVDHGVLRINFNATLVDYDRGPLADDVLEARWFTRQELEELIRQGQLRSRRTELAIKDWLAGCRSGAELVQTVVDF